MIVWSFLSSLLLYATSYLFTRSRSFVSLSTCSERNSRVITNVYLFLFFSFVFHRFKKQVSAKRTTPFQVQSNYDDIQRGSSSPILLIHKYAGLPSRELNPVPVRRPAHSHKPTSRFHFSHYSKQKKIQDGQLLRTLLLHLPGKCWLKEFESSKLSGKWD